MNKTKIEYLTHTWNPLAMRCTPVSEGCANCWHLRIADRLAGMKQFSDEVQAAYAGEGPPVLVEDRLEEPLRRKKPAVIGVQFMGDLFHENVDVLDIACVFGIMAAAQHHTFLILTKRPKYMRQIVEKEIAFWAAECFSGESALSQAFEFDAWPLSNVWVGVTVENQQAADERIPWLLQTPAARRWVSVEPMLSPVSITDQPYWDWRYSYEFYPDSWRPIDLVVVGCESGPDRRPTKIEWVRDLVTQCQDADVPVFVKQVEINGRVSHDPSEWPEELRVREMPEVQ